MTKKEFKEHNWKAGEEIYHVCFKEYEYVSIPYRVLPVQVRMVEDGWVYTNGAKYPPTGLNETSIHLKYFFFNKEEADRKLRELKDDFVQNKKDRVVSTLKELRRRLHNDYLERTEKIDNLLQLDILGNGNV